MYSKTFVTGRARSCGEIERDRVDSMFFRMYDGRYKIGAHFISKQNEFEVV